MSTDSSLDKSLIVKDLSITLPSGKVLLKPISFKLEAGKVLGLVGETGSGKTILTQALGGLLPDAMTVSGKVEYAGQMLLDISPQKRRSILGSEISYIFQDPLTALNPLQRLGKQISEAIELKSDLITRADLDKKMLEIVEDSQFYTTDGEGKKDLSRLLKSFPHQLSGGQRQRALIAIAIANKPSLLIADEPTTALDSTLRLEILRLLKSLQNNFNMSLILVSHDIKVVSAMSDQIIVLKDGACVEHGSKKILQNPSSDYTKLLLQKAVRRKAIKGKELPPVVRAKNLSVKYSITKGLLRKKVGEVVALKNASFDMHPLKTLAVMGESGAGKTTLALAMLGLIDFQGELYLNDKQLKKLTKKEKRLLRSKVTIVLQDPFSSLSPRMNILSIVAEGLIVHHKNINTKQREEMVRQQLAKVNLDQELMYRYPHELSGGQRQRVALARGLILNPTTIILDEPTASLDRKTEDEILQLLEDLQKKLKLSYLLITHDIKVARRLADRAMVLLRGEIIEYGKADQVFDNPKHDYTKALVSAINLNFGNYPFNLTK